MRLWTVQPLSAMEAIEKSMKNSGYFACNTELSEEYPVMKKSYDWLVSQMDARGIVHPSGVELPLWAWHTRDWKRTINVSDIGLGVPNREYACIEFEIEDSRVLLSDYNAWHYVLNRMWLEDSKCEEEFDANTRWFNAQPSEVKNRLMLESWQKIFNVAPYKSDWFSNGRYVQATFWKLEKDMIRNIETFVAK